ncbi:MFS transporter [Novosphingobium sp.]|uniref:MFS transporter n=1 Tax=Novosphingobium sp. TaxID=1874826 RepID=UPI00261B0FE1|nr:MFS transporter [Novosphingobium sp.]
MTPYAPAPAAHSRLAVAAAILMGVVAAFVSNTLPAFLSVLGRARGLSESQAGLCAMADLGGIALGVTACALLPALVQRLGWRMTVASGAMILIAANLASIVITGFAPYLAIRLLAGCGSGIIIAIVYAILAEGDGARALAIYNIGQLGCAAFAVQFFNTLADTYGVSVLFAIIAGLSAASLALVPFLPRESTREMAAEAQHSHAPETISPAGWTGIAAVFAMFFGVGSVYGFLAYMGAAWGLDAAAVEGDISLVLLAGMAAAGLVTLIGSRFGYQRSMVFGFGLLLLAIAVLIVFKPVGGFLATAAMFYFAVNFTMAYQFEAVTEVDPSSSAAMLVSGATLGGVATGPAVAGYLVTRDFVFVNATGFIACTLSLVLILLAQTIHAKAQQTAGT